MSTVNVDGVVKSIRGTTPFTPLVEVVVNAIQAIEEADIPDGKIVIRVIRGGQESTDGRHEIVGFEIEDNGIGFDQAHLDAFDELYTTCKAKTGGKGFGRFTALKYFDDVAYSSVFRDNAGLHEVSFKMGRKNSIIEDCVEQHQTDKKNTGTLVRLISKEQSNKFGFVIDNIAEKLLEKLLPCFIDEEKACPVISISEQDGSSAIVLNESVNSESSNNIREIQSGSFQIRGRIQQEHFNVRVFKFYHPFVKRNSNNTLSLVAHGREVISDPLKEFIPEFQDEFQEMSDEKKRTFIVRAYVFGDLLDRTVSLERCTFDFVDDNDLQYGISKKQIETATANEVKRIMSDDIQKRFNDKKAKVEDYVNTETPWYKSIIDSVDLSKLQTNPSSDEIEFILHTHAHNRNVEIKKRIQAILLKTDVNGLSEAVQSILSEIHETNKDDLIQYVVRRKSVINLLEKCLETNDDEKYEREEMLHNIIFPRSSDSLTLPYNNHNLWLIDERLSFSSYISSDKYINKEDKPDLLIFNNARMSFREQNVKDNPITIIEFKRPGRFDFVSKREEDPVEQLVRYAASIKAGNFKTPKGKEIAISDNTPFYGYIVCTLNKNVKNWLHLKNFKPLPDEMGWFWVHDNLNLYIEVLDWDKVVQDAEKHHAAFFRKLGIN